MPNGTPTRVDAYSATNATPQPQTRNIRARPAPRSRDALTKKTMRNANTYGLSRTVPASSDARNAGSNDMTGPSSIRHVKRRVKVFQERDVRSRDRTGARWSARNVGGTVSPLC